MSEAVVVLNQPVSTDGGTQVSVRDDSVNDLLQEILVELKKLNLMMAQATELSIGNEDV